MGSLKCIGSRYGYWLPHCSWRLVVQLLSRVWLFAALWTAARQASLSFTLSWSLLRLMSSESVMPSNHLVLCHPFFSCLLSFRASRSFPVSCLFASGGQRIRASALASVLPMNVQSWFPLGLTGLISLQSKGLKSLLQHHSTKTSVLWCSAFFMDQLLHPYMTTDSSDLKDLCQQSNVSAF